MNTININQENYKMTTATHYSLIDEILTKKDNLKRVLEAMPTNWEIFNVGRLIRVSEENLKEAIELLENLKSIRNYFEEKRHIKIQEPIIETFKEVNEFTDEEVEEELAIMMMENLLSPTYKDFEKLVELLSLETDTEEWKKEEVRKLKKMLMEVEGYHTYDFKNDSMYRIEFDYEEKLLKFMNLSIEDHSSVGDFVDIF